MKLIEYKTANVKGYAGMPILIDDEFKPTMDIINDECEKQGFTFIATSAKRKSLIVPGAIVEPAKMSNHLVGHAIDGNLIHNYTGAFFNSVKMGDGTGIDEKLIQAIIDRGVRYGGNFRKEDNVHFDDALNLKDPKKWHELNKIFNNK